MAHRTTDGRLLNLTLIQNCGFRFDPSLTLPDWNNLRLDHSGLLLLARVEGIQLRHAFHPPDKHRESKGIEPRSFPHLSFAFASGRVCLFGQITEKREKCWRLPNKKAHGRQEFESGRRRACSIGRANNGARRQTLCSRIWLVRHDQVRLEILSAKWRGIEVRKYEC